MIRRILRVISQIPVSPAAAKKIPAALGLAFFCWLAFDVVDINQSEQPVEYFEADGE